MTARQHETPQLVAKLRLLNRRESRHGLTFRERCTRRLIVRELDSRNVWTRAVRQPH